jgi:hypothetical protein
MLKGVGDPPGARRLLLAAAFAIVILLATPSSGQGAQIFGSNLISPSNRVIPCNNDSCSVWHVGLSAANTANSTFAPMTGVVTSFTLKKQAGNWPFIHLRVAIPLSSIGPWRGGARSADVLPTNTAGTQTLPIRLPVTAGDFVAISGGGGGNLYAGSDNPATAARKAEPALPADGSPVNAIIEDNLEVLAQYTVEADADGDGFGDETQDKCPGKNGPDAGCPAKKKCKKKKKGKGRAAAKKKKGCKKKKKKKRKKQ